MYHHLVFSLLTFGILCLVKDTVQGSVTDSIADNTKLCLYSSATKDKCIQIKVNDSSTISQFDATKATKFIVPGWADNLYNFESQARKAYLAAESVNVITFDWLFYTLNQRAVIVPVGEYLGQFLDWLITETGVSVDSIHVIGFSLGGQLVGAIGEHVTVGKLGRITGLDPVALTFNNSTSGRLDPSDAQFVDVIHTCGNLIGWYDPCGHVDFYPNHGTFDQPGCLHLDYGVCSHLRAYEIFIESITSGKFVSTPCDSWFSYELGLCSKNATSIMGEHIDKTISGTYYLRTASSSPYALG